MTPGIDVNEVFRRTMGDVARESENQQRPAVYSQFSETAYLGDRPSAALLPVIALQPAPPVPIPQDPRRNNRAIGYGFMNLAFGLGSYMQGDTLGGIITTGGWVVGVVLNLYAFKDNGGNVTPDGQGHFVNPSQVIPALAIGGGTIIFGFIRPLVYNKNHQLASVMDKVDIGLVSDENNKAGLRLGYTYSF
jgi:hypothetical protein